MHNLFGNVSWVWQGSRPRYEPLGQGNSLLDPETNTAHPNKSFLTLTKRRLGRWSSTRTVMVLFLILLVPTTLYMASGSSHHTSNSSAGHDVAPAPTESRAGPHDRRLVIVIPTDHGHQRLCKTIFSAMILGYPSPVIVNWGNTYDLDDDSKWLGNSHMSKITGTLEYLDFMSRKEAYEADRLMDDDLVLVVDAFDIWFQLPPEVLLQRYHRTIQAANARLAEQWDSHGNSSVPMPMEQTILISPQKRCWPGPSSHSDLSCDALPESPVREDLYGPDTDEDPENNYQHSRPRYINSGSIMGPVRDMRRFFRRANDKTENHYSDGTQMSSDQGVFGEVWGEQEVWRTWAREQHRVGADKTGDRAQTLIQSDFEYHVSLDYYEQLFVATVFHEEDGDIVKLNNRTAIEFESRYRNIPTRLDGLPDDIKGSPLPRQVAAVGLGQGHRRDWGDMPLYADFYSATVPAVIHHNAHINNLKTRRETWWDRIWFFPYLRQLMEERLQPGSLQVLAAITTKSGSNDITYRALLSDETKRKPRLFKSADFKSGVQEAETFDGICSDWDPEREKKRRWFDEIFRDGNGPI